MNEPKKPKLFTPEHPSSVAILSCWTQLSENKGDRAELRRCKNLEEIQQSSAFQRIYWQLAKAFKTNNEKPSRIQLANIIALWSYIDDALLPTEDTDNQPIAFGYQLAAAKSPENSSPKLSELRFRRLLKIDDRDKLFRFLIQAIRILDKKVNLLDFSGRVYFWGDNTKTELAYQYYEKAQLD